MSEANILTEVNSVISSVIESSNLGNLNQNTTITNSTNMINDNFILNQYSHFGWFIGVIILLAINIGPFVYYKIKNKSSLRSSNENKNGINDSI